MPNGKPGDHPMTDILIHGRDIYSPLARNLIREISRMADERTLRELGDLLLFKYNEFNSPNIAELEHYLTSLHDKLRKEAIERGFEV